MGRVTFQKGPDYFVEAARLVLNVMPDVRFVVAGSGDMLRSIVARVAHYRMGHRFTFTGFLKHDEVDRMYVERPLRHAQRFRAFWHSAPRSDGV